MFESDLVVQTRPRVLFHSIGCSLYSCSQRPALCFGAVGLNYSGSGGVFRFGFVNVVFCVSIATLRSPRPLDLLRLFHGGLSQWVVSWRKVGREVGDDFIAGWCVSPNFCWYFPRVLSLIREGVLLLFSVDFVFLVFVDDFLGLVNSKVLKLV